MDPVELDCFELKQAVKGLGTDEETLIEILASRSNERIKAINETYQKSMFQYLFIFKNIFFCFLVYSKALEKDVKSDTSGDFRRLLVSLMQGRRPETTEINVEQAKQDAQSLLDAGAAKFGTDEAKFNVLFCDRSDPQLRAIFNEYAKITGKSIGKKFILIIHLIILIFTEEAVKSETSGDLQKGILAIIRCVRSRPFFFAEQLRKAMKVQ
jgi:hypothetical protein